MANATTRRELLRCGGQALALASLGPFFHTGRAGELRRPNFLFLLTDDQSYATLSCTGHPFMKTPNIDSLRRGGVLFTNGFVAMSLCAPSRACFLSGQYPFSNGIYNNQIRWNQQTQTLPMLLHEAGYTTAHIGKFHMDGDDRLQPGYDYWAAQIGQGQYLDPRKNINGTWTDLKGYDTNIVTDQAAEFIRRVPRDKPFCVWIGYKACHGPFTPAPGHERDFADIEIEPPASYYSDNAGKPARLRQKGNRANAAGRKAAKAGKAAEKAARKAAGGNPDPSNLKEWAERERNQFRCLMGAEDSVGRLLALLEERKIADDTIVFYSGDNGFFHGEHGGLHGKMEAYEESLRVPMIARYPRLIKPGQTCEAMVANVDLAPTILDFCGMPAPKQMQGRSWRPLATGSPNAGRRDCFLYSMYGAGADPQTPTVKAIRTNRYKLILSLNPADVEELYDLKSDPQEMKNLAGAGTQDQVRKLKERMLAEMRELGDPAVPLVEASLKRS
jgi:N-acetylglucosamine-6-sulfatase